MWKNLVNKASRTGRYDISQQHQKQQKHQHQQQNLDSDNANNLNDSITLKSYAKIHSTISSDDDEAAANHTNATATAHGSSKGDRRLKMLMQLEDFQNNNTTSSSRSSSSSRSRLVDCNDKKLKQRSLLDSRPNDNQYYLSKDGLEIEVHIEKFSPPKMKRRQKDLLSDQNTKNGQTDFSKKVVPEIHKDCNCGSNGSSSVGHDQNSHSSKSFNKDKSPLKSAVQSEDHNQSRASPGKSISDALFSPNYCKPKKGEAKQILKKTNSTRPFFENEPTHMSWEEVMQEAKMLGIPLKNQKTTAAVPVRTGLKEIAQSVRHGKNFYSDSDECYRAGLSTSRETTSMASSASSIGMRQPLPETKKSERSPQTFKGMVKLQNFFKRLELKQKSPCHHCQVSKSSSVRDKHSSPKSFFRDFLASQKTKEPNSQAPSRAQQQQKTTWRECEQCIRQCRYCHSLEKASSKSRGGVDPRLVSSVDEKEVADSMARSWEPESSFDKLSLPTKSSSLNRRLQNVSYQSSCYSLSSKIRQMTFDSRDPSPVGSEMCLTENAGRRRNTDCAIQHETLTKTPSYEINPQDDMNALRNVLWYWGSLDREGANGVLKDTEDGCFLLRNSSDDRYVLALSFRSQGMTHHTGIEHANGFYSFHERSPPIDSSSTQLPLDATPPKESIVHFIERASNLSKSKNDRYYLQPRSSEEAIVPVKLWNPMLRPVERLRNMSADAVVKALRAPDCILKLPVIPTLRRLVKNRYQTKFLS